jgi:hypothetical protein
MSTVIRHDNIQLCCESLITDPAIQILQQFLNNMHNGFPCKWVTDSQGVARQQFDESYYKIYNNIMLQIHSRRLQIAQFYNVDLNHSDEKH